MSLSVGAGGEATPKWDVRHSLVVVLVSAEAAAAQQWEQDDQQEGDQGSCGDHTHPLVGLWKMRRTAFVGVPHLQS